MLWVSSSSTEYNLILFFIKSIIYNDCVYIFSIYIYIYYIMYNNNKIYLYEIIILILILFFINYQKNKYCLINSFKPEKVSPLDILKLKNKYKHHIIIDYIYTKDGNKLMYILYNYNKKPEWTDNIVFICHGNSSWLGNCLDNSFVDIVKHYASILIFDYRGYGRSTGTVSEAGIYMDTLAMWNYIKIKKNVSTSQITLYGNSLGTSIVSYLAYTLKKNNRELPKHMILTSSFYNFKYISKDLFPGFGNLNNLNFTTNIYLKDIYNDISIYYMHSINDEKIDIYHSHKLNLECPGKFYKLDGVHNNLIYSNKAQNEIEKIFINNINK